ncbi:hypothetical protein [Trujillonella humicola]|uniref:hypothetical protein n=1 Tax=Trujillonella humicola TaxID=3383699 RepID=UPI003906CC25
MMLWAATQVPEDVGKSGPFGLLLLVVGLIVIGFLVRSMTRHLKRVPPSFDRVEDGPDVVVPDTPAELLEERRQAPGDDLLDTLRRAPRAIEPPRDGDQGPADRS